MFSSWLTEPEIPGLCDSGLPSAHDGAAHNKDWYTRGGRDGRNVKEEKTGSGLARGEAVELNPDPVTRG